MDANLWGRSIECGILEDPWAEPPADVWELDRQPRHRARRARRDHHHLRAGRAHRAGRRDTGPRNAGAEARTRWPARTAWGASTTSRIGWSASSRARSTRLPQAITLLTAHAAMEALTLSREQVRVKGDVGRRICAADLQRPLVQRAARRPDGLHAQFAALRLRRSAAEALARARAPSSVAARPIRSISMRWQPMSAATPSTTTARSASSSCGVCRSKHRRRRSCSKMARAQTRYCSRIHCCWDRRSTVPSKHEAGGQRPATLAACLVFRRCRTSSPGP